LAARHAETARRVMTELHSRGIAEFVEEGAGKAAHLNFREEWAWCASPEFTGLFSGQPVINRGVCVSPITINLAQRQEEKKGEERKGHAHPPRNDKCPGIGGPGDLPPLGAVTRQAMQPEPTTGHILSVERRT
jgi:hypothetical protein